MSTLVLVLMGENGKMNFRKLRSLTTSDDTLIALLTEQPSYDSAGQSFSYSRTDISLCETFARLVSRLKAVPALFAVVEEVFLMLDWLRHAPPLHLCLFPDRSAYKNMRRAECGPVRQ
jgi:hypothetical protein